MAAPDERFPVLLADGPQRRATAARPLLDAGGYLTRPFRGETQGPALLLVDPQRADADQLLAKGDGQFRPVALPEDTRSLVPLLEEAALGLGLPDLSVNIKIAAIGSEFAATPDLDSLLDLSVQRARELVDAEAGAILLVDPDTRELVFRIAAGGTGQGLVDVRIPPGKGIAGWVVEHRIPTLSTDPSQDPRFDNTQDSRSGFVTRSVAAVPIFWRGEVVGVLEAVNRRDGPFVDRDMRTLVALAPHVGIALTHTRAAQELRARVEAAQQRSMDLEALVQQRTAILVKGKRDWEQTFDAIAEPLALMEGFVVRRANRAYAARAGVDITQVPGRVCYGLLGRTEPCPGCPLARQPRALMGELEVPPGRRAAMRGYQLQDGVVVHYRDVTSERALEAKLRDSDRLAVVGQLAAGAAHEINNPLGFIASNLATLEEYFQDLAQVASRLDLVADLARTGRVKEIAAVLGRTREAGTTSVTTLIEEAGALIGESRTGLRRVADIVKALKELGKEELPGRGEPVPIATAAELALRQVSQEHPMVRVKWTSRDESPVQGQPLQLQQAIRAVLKNAFQAAQIGGLDVEIGTQRLGDEIVVRISDNGPGIDEAIRTRVFEPFFTTRGVGGGVGLGLTAAWGIATRHGGHIELMPRDGGGTVAVLSFPTADAADVVRRKTVELPPVKSRSA